jgi:hypothetical protein
VTSTVRSEPAIDAATDSFFGVNAFVNASDAYRVGMNQVRELTATTRMLQRWDRQFGGWVPYEAAVGHVDSAMRLVRGSYSEKIGRLLLPAVADLCAVAGWVAYDVGRHEKSLTYFALGAQVAQRGEDRVLAARLLCDLARVNADLGNAPRAVELLGIAGHVVARGGATAAVLAKIHSMEAKTYAILGRSEACRHALDRAEAQLAPGKSTDDPAWIEYFDNVQFAGVVGSCYRDLAAVDASEALRAEAPIQLAMANRRAEQVRNRALDHVNLAVTRLCRRELDGMCEEGNRAAELAGRLKSHRVGMRLRMLVRQAASLRDGHAGVQSLVERVAQLPKTNH